MLVYQRINRAMPNQFEYRCHKKVGTLEEVLADSSGKAFTQASFGLLRKMAVFAKSGRPWKPLTMVMKLQILDAQI